MTALGARTIEGCSSVVTGVAFGAFGCSAVAVLVFERRLSDTVRSGLSLVLGMMVISSETCGRKH